MFTRTGKYPTGHYFRLAMTLVVIAVMAFALPVTKANAYSGNPYLAVNSVVEDSLVKVLVYNLPKDEMFTVRMNTHGTYGLGGYSTATFDSGDGSARLMTFETPSPLYGEYIIDLRIDSAGGDYSATTSFVNSTSGTSTYPPVYVPIPTTSIVSVVTDEKVTLQTYNFPANLDFTVRMGAYGTYGINGIVVGTTNSGSGGSFQVTYNIPSALKGSYQIAIRLESPQGYFAYDWFYNNTSGSTGTGGQPTATPAPSTGYVGIPTFSIKSVVKDGKVTVSAYNFPPNQTFTVRMNYYGSLGLGGITVGSKDTGSGGNFEATYDIPAALQGNLQIAIRMDSTTTGYYAYNWFWNNTYP
jgi:hypothetical protein